MNRQFYKGHYILTFYTLDDEVVHTFNNIREILNYIDKPINRYNAQYVKLLLYRALRRESHITYLLGSRMRVYMIDINDDEEDIDEEE